MLDMGWMPQKWPNSSSCQGNVGWFDDFFKVSGFGQEIRKILLRSKDVMSALCDLVWLFCYVWLFRWLWLPWLQDAKASAYHALHCDMAHGGVSSNHFWILQVVVFSFYPPRSKIAAVGRCNCWLRRLWSPTRPSVNEKATFLSMQFDGNWKFCLLVRSWLETAMSRKQTRTLYETCWVGACLSTCQEGRI